MKTLYEVLEVSEKASDEVIEKAYKVLAKKYHPDLQTPENKETAEGKMKQLNDAYETLSNKAKRAEYDAGLQRLRMEEDLRKQNAINQNNVVQTRVVYTTNPNMQVQNQYRYSDIKMQNEKERLRIKLINIRDMLIAIIIILAIIGILWLIPPTRELMIEFYEGNFIIKAIVEAIKSIFT